MKSPRLHRAIRRANLGLLLAEFGGPTQLQALTGVTDTYLSAISNGRRELGDKAAAKLETGCGKPAGWMDEEHGPQVAHALSYGLSTVSIPTLRREDLMAREPIDALFKMQMTDDSAGHQYPPGSWIIWSTDRAPSNGKLILVKDAFGRPHVRVRHEGKLPGTWSAVAINSAYPSFDGDEVTLIAVYRGAMDP